MPISRPFRISLEHFCVGWFLFLSLSALGAPTGSSDTLGLPSGAVTASPAATDRPRVYVFLSPRCPCSRSHEDTLKKIHAEFGDDRFEWIGLHANADESAAESEAHFRAANLPFPIREDTDQKLADRFGALKTPHVFIVRGDRVLYSGGVDDSKVSAHAKIPFLETALRQIAEKGEARPAETRTLGCVIARRP